jgi:hypothetical protein
MGCSHSNGRRRISTAAPGRVLPALLLALSLIIPVPSSAVTDNGKKGAYEDRAAAEKMSRSRFRDLEVASLVVILVAGAGATLWAVRRRKP